MIEIARWLLPLLVAVAVVVVLDRATSRRRLQLPGLEPELLPGARARRALALGAIGVALYLGVFAPLGMLGVDRDVDYAAVPTGQLFALHGVFVVALAVYLAAGLTPTATLDDEGPKRRWARELGLVTGTPGRELGLGLAAGVAGWVVVLVMLSLVAAAVLAFGGEQALPDRPPPMIVWIAGLHWSVRVALAVSAGVVEETFFRGFLQPRIGILGSSLLFVLAHASYDQPFLLLGVTALSFGFAALTAWRRTIWPAVVAHTLFDAIQLLVLIPTALRVMESAP